MIEDPHGPRRRLWVRRGVKVGEQRSIAEVPQPTDIVGHGICDAGDVVMKQQQRNDARADTER